MFVTRRRRAQREEKEAEVCVSVCVCVCVSSQVQALTSDLHSLRSQVDTLTQTMEVCYTHTHTCKPCRSGRVPLSVCRRAPARARARVCVCV